jgi:hypothetical protein
VSEDLIVIACLRLNEAPQLLLHTPEYEKSSCDFCAAPILVLRKVHSLAAVRGAAKACTWCIGLRLQAYTEAMMHCAANSAQG